MDGDLAQPTPAQSAVTLPGRPGPDHRGIRVTRSAHGRGGPDGGPRPGRIPDRSRPGWARAVPCPGPLPAQRRVIDVVRLAAGRPTIHRLIEVDVTGLQERLAGLPIVGR